MDGRTETGEELVMAQAAAYVILVGAQSVGKKVLELD